MILFFFGLVTHVADGIDRYKGLGIYLADVVHQLLVLVFVYDGDHFHFRLLVVSTDDLVQRSTGVQGVQNIINDVVQILRDHADAALDVDTKDEVIYQHTAEVRSQQAKDNCLTIVAKSGRQGHGNTGIGHSLSQIHSQILVHDFRHDIQTAGRSISREQNGQAHTDYQNIADHIQQRILGDGLEVGEEPFKDTHDHRHQYGAIDGLGAKLWSNQDEADDQQSHVHNQGDGGNRKGNEIAQHHGKGGTATYRNMAWQHEEENSSCDDGCTNRNDSKLFDGIADFRGINLFIFGVTLYYTTFSENVQMSIKKSSA